MVRGWRPGEDPSVAPDGANARTTAIEPLPSFHGLIGRSAVMQALFARIEQVAPLDVPVLILGESGTGKELVAAAVHRLSARCDRRHQIVNCGAIPRELLFSELFGHGRGAFTGADARRVGLLAAAGGGTLFLDEVGELPLEAQSMLLRFLQQGEVRPLGSTETTRVDVRLISATHRNLKAAVREGAFRDDLRYRLRRGVLQVPPLRARREDIPLLVEHFRREINRRWKLAVEGITPEAMALLEEHPWPGNVRELEAVLEQAMIFQGGGWMRPEHLELDTEEDDKRPGAAVDLHPPKVEDDRPRDALRREAALRIAGERDAVSPRLLARECGISEELARQQLVALARLGLLRREGGGRSTRYVLA
jgi:DNA-binding NtrC family response regulator